MNHAILFILCLVLYSNVLVAGNIEYRFSPKLIGKLNDHWSTSLQYEVRGDEHFEQSRDHIDLGVIYTGRKEWLDVSFNVRQISKKLTTGTTKEEKYYLSFIARQKVMKLALSHRFRFEYNNFDDSFGDFGTVKYQISLNPPYEFKPSRERQLLDEYMYRPYSKYEISYNTLDDAISSHSLLFGLSLKLKTPFITNFYYQRKRITSLGEDVRQNILALEMKYIF